MRCPAGERKKGYPLLRLVAERAGGRAREGVALHYGRCRTDSSVEAGWARASADEWSTWAVLWWVCLLREGKRNGEQHGLGRSDPCFERVMRIKESKRARLLFCPRFKSVLIIHARGSTVINPSRRLRSVAVRAERGNECPCREKGWAAQTRTRADSPPRSLTPLP